LDFYRATSLKQQSTGRQCRSILTYYPDSEPASLVYYSLMLRVMQRIRIC